MNSRRRFLLTCVAALPAFALAAEASETAVGGHGMADFGGREGLFASHLPMFHAPHDSQILLRFHLADPAADKTLRETLAREPKLWTFDPETFDLLRLGPGYAQPLREFKARFFEGHVERGGKPMQRSAADVADDGRRLEPRVRGVCTGRGP